MSNHSEKATRGQTIGGAIFGLAIVFCSMEMVPGWGIFHLGWPYATFFIIAGTAGLISGALLGGRYFVPGATGGTIAAVGALAAIAFMLERVNWTHSVFLIIVGALGCLPGIMVAIGGKHLQNLIVPPRIEDES